jgi:hypothetical protein
MTHALSSIEVVIARSLKSACSWIPSRLLDYPNARKVLRGSISKRSRLGLDWLNFFLADIQTGFGAFVAFYLADLGWDKGQVGLALSAGTVAGLVAHLPGGAIVDWVPWKRGFVALGIVMIAVSALILAVAPTFILVFAAEILHGLSGGIVTPAIAAISLGLVGRGAMSARTGRNNAYDAAGMPLRPAPWVPPFLEQQRCVSQPLSRCCSYVAMRWTTRELATPESVAVQLIFSAFLIWAKTRGCTFSLPVFFCSNLPMRQCFR